jgi:hypothetical protein
MPKWILFLLKNSVVKFANLNYHSPCIDVLSIGLKLTDPPEREPLMGLLRIASQPCPQILDKAEKDSDKHGAETIFIFKRIFQVFKIGQQ